MTSFHRITFAILVLAAAGCKDMGTEPQTALPPAPPPGAAVSFSHDVLPIFNRYGCTGCHGGSGNLLVGTVSQLLTGGVHGAAIVAGQADNSILIKKLSDAPPFGSRMPQGGPFLPDSTVTVLRNWINQGALNN
jgi:hypothetical protein